MLVSIICFHPAPALPSGSAFGAAIFNFSGKEMSATPTRSRLGDMDLYCTLCGTSLHFIPDQISVWANQDWDPPVCGSACGEYFLPFIRFQWWADQDAKRDKIQAWLETTMGGSCNDYLPRGILPS